MDAQAVERLPTFVALEAQSVLNGQRRGASIPLDATYFDGIRLASQSLTDVQVDVDPRNRIQHVQQSELLLQTASIGLDSFEREELLGASEQLRETAERLPEVEFLREAYPGDCVVVPEWVRTGRAADWGLRIYFFREGDAPTPDEIVTENVDAVVEGTRPAFERYQGDLHGYPECCVAAFHDRAQDRPSPEWRSVEPLASEVREDALAGDSVSIDGVLPDVFESEGVPSLVPFFAREFFPEQDCETARETGAAVYDALCEEFDETLVRDHFALNYALCYWVAKTLREQAANRGRRPAAGELGIEHFSFYAPLGHVRTFPRYS